MTLAPRQIHLDFHTSEAIPDMFLPAATTDGCIIHQNGFRN